MSIKESIQAVTPASFKDARITLEQVLAQDTAKRYQAAAYAVSLTTKSKALANIFQEGLTEAEKEMAETAVAIMGMTNIYYSFTHMFQDEDLTKLPPNIRMVSYGAQLAKDKIGFEMVALAVSLIGKCVPCVVNHAKSLKAEGVSAEELRDLARTAAAVHALSKVV